MQRPDDAQLAAHIAGEDGERRPAMRFEVDWTGNGDWQDVTEAVDRLSVDRSITGDLPAEAGLIDGYASSTCDVELSGSIDVAGEDWPVSEALSPFVPGSLRDGRQLVRARARASLGMVLDDGEVLMPQWTGPVREVANDRGEGRVTIQGVDPSDRLRAPITLPTYAEFITHAARRPWALTVNTQWIVDHILRRNGIYASPPARAEAIISCTGHGGLVAERGHNGAPISIYGTGPTGDVHTEDPAHPFNMLATAASNIAATIGYQEFYGQNAQLTPPVEFRSGFGVGFSCWVRWPTSRAFGGENRLFRILPTETDTPALFVNVLANGDLSVGLSRGAASTLWHRAPAITPSTSSTWKFLGVHWRWSNNTTLIVTIRLDGTTRTFTLTHPAVSVVPTWNYAGYRPSVHLNARLVFAWTNLQLWPGFAPPPAGPWQGESHTPEADIGRGVNELIYLPDVVNEDSYELLKDVVSAEFGVHSFDENGRYSFRARTDVRPEDVDVDLDVETNLADVKYSTSTDSVRNVVGVHTSAYYHSGVEQTVVEAVDIFEYVIPVGTSIYNMPWPHGAAGRQGGVLPYHKQVAGESLHPTWSDDVIHGFTYSHGTDFKQGSNSRTGGTGGVTVRWAQVSPRRVQLRISNPGPGPIRLATAASDTEAGQPAIRIAGWPLEKVVDVVEEVRAPAARIDAHLGERVLTLESNDWRQRPEAVRPLARQLLEALAEEVTVLEDLTIVGDPRVQAGDVARCNFRDGSPPIIGTVVSTNPEATTDGLGMTVSVRPLPAPGLAPEGWSFFLDISHHQGNPPGPLDLPRAASLGYAGCIVRIGQAEHNRYNGTVFNTILDTWWYSHRDQALALWPNTMAAYWYVGDRMSPAAQAAFIADAIGDPTIPLVLDWEEGSGTWANLMAVLDACRERDLNPTMVYVGRSHAGRSDVGPIDIPASGLHLWAPRYWINDPAGGNPRDLWNAQSTGFGYDAVAGTIPRAHQFTQYGRLWEGSPVNVDVNSFPGSRAQLAALIHGDDL